MLSLTRRVAAGGLIALGAVALAVLVLPKLFGWDAMIVTSGSMAPTFGTGAVVVVSQVDPNSVSIGDIVSFRDPDGYTTHRVVGMESKSIAGKSSYEFTTKGDANEDADPTPLDPRNVVGRAEFAVPHLGYAIDFIKTPIGAGLFAALFLFVVFTGGKHETVPRAAQLAKEDAVAA